MPACLLVNKVYACIKPAFFKEADKGVCKDYLCPKYSKCKAKHQDAGYYLLRCIFDPGMLPLPPTFQANKIRVKDLESILAEVKKENTYLEKLVGKGNAKSIRDDVQKEANTVCQGRQGIDKNEETLTCMWKEITTRQIISSSIYKALDNRNTLELCPKNQTELSSPSSLNSSDPGMCYKDQRIEKELNKIITKNPDIQKLCELKNAMTRQNSALERIVSKAQTQTSFKNRHKRSSGKFNKTLAKISQSRNMVLNTDLKGNADKKGSEAKKKIKKKI